MTYDEQAAVEALKAAYKAGEAAGGHPQLNAGRACPHKPGVAPELRKSWFDGFSRGRAADTFIGTVGRYTVR